MKKPLCIDTFCGLGGWTEGFLAEGYSCIGFDIERHDYGTGSYPGQLVLQDVRTLNGSQFRHAAVIVGSSPCQKYSYMAMPWSRAKRMRDYYEGANEDWSIFGDGIDDRDHDSEYRARRRQAQLNELFLTQFRLQREASEAAGRYIPLIVENVRGAQEWVGPAQWSYGSFYLWGDIPALMPMPNSRKGFGGGSWFHTNRADPRDMRRVARVPTEHMGREAASAEKTEPG